MSLWAEHTGKLEQCFEQPESLDCIRRIRWMGEQNWSQFAANEVSEMRGRLIKYPVDVDRMGKVRPLPWCETLLAPLSNSPFKRISLLDQTIV